MTKASFVFIACFLLLSPLLYLGSGLAIETQLMLCMPFILLIGIPHGAIDNLIYLKNKRIKNSHFIAVYVFLIACNVGLWFISPVFAYFLFLLISAYHFGESQFSHYFKSPKLWQFLLFFSWGFSALAGLIYFNLAELQGIMNSVHDFAVLKSYHSSAVLQYSFFIGVSVTVVTLLLHLLRGWLKPEKFLLEILVFSLVLLSFYVFSFLVGFTFYFVTLHSYKVLVELYRFFKLEKKIFSVIQLSKLLAPLSFISFAGIGFYYALVELELFQISFGYGLLVIISSITLPHVFVMNHFYRVSVIENYKDKLVSLENR